MIKPRPSRPAHEYINHFVPPPFDRRELATSDSVRNELIASIEMYSEVKDIGRQLLTSNGHINLKAAYPRLQAYLRQGKAFFKAAEQLEYRASPLSYYYSFMNLAKACALVRDPAFVDNHLMHGLSASGTGSLARHYVTMHKAGVFQEFYKRVIGKLPPAAARVSVRKLLAYVSDVSFERQQCQMGPSRMHNMRLVGAACPDGAYGILAVFATDTVFQRPPKELLASPNFDVVQMSSVNAMPIFGLPAGRLPGTLFLETKKLWPRSRPGQIPFADIAKYVADALGARYLVMPFDHEYGMQYNELIQPRMEMNEALAIYLITFYLGSLVRYRPWVLEAMLETKDAWIIERFVKSTPITLLRHLRNMLDGQNLVYITR